MNLKGYQGAIEIVKEGDTNRDTCIWTILAPKGSTINITFTEFEISKSFIRTPINLEDDSDILNSPLPFNSLNRYYPPRSLVK